MDLDVPFKNPNVWFASAFVSYSLQNNGKVIEFFGIRLTVISFTDSQNLSRNYYG